MNERDTYEYVLLTYCFTSGFFSFSRVMIMIDGNWLRSIVHYKSSCCVFFPRPQSTHSFTMFYSSSSPSLLFDIQWTRIIEEKEKEKKMNDHRRQSTNFYLGVCLNHIKELYARSNILSVSLFVLWYDCRRATIVGKYHCHIYGSVDYQ